MPPELNIRRFKGLRYYRSMAEKAQNELSKADNVRLDNEGVLMSRAGIDHVNMGLANSVTDPTAASATFLLTNSAAGNNNAFWAMWGTRGWKSDMSTPTSMVEQTGGVALVQARDWNATIYDDKIFTGNGKWVATTGTAFAAITGWPTATLTDYVVLHKERLFVTIVQKYDSYRIWFSKPTPTTADMWSATDFFDIRSNSPIKALVSFKDNLYVFKPDSIWMVSTGGDPINWVTRKIGEQGSFGGACVHNSVMYWVGEDGVFSYNGVQITRISDPIQTYFSQNRFEYSIYSQIVGFEDDLYMCMDRRVTAAEGNTNREYWIYNISQQAWFRMQHNLGKNYLHRMHVVNSRYGILNDNVEPGVYVGNAGIAGVQRPHMWRLDRTKPYDVNHAGAQTNFTVDVETPQLDFEEPHKKKRIRYLTIEGCFTELNVTQFDERGVNKVFSRTVPAYDPEKIGVYRIPGLGYFRSLRIKVTLNPAAGGLRFYGLRAPISMQGKERGDSVGVYADTTIR